MQQQLNASVQDSNPESANPKNKMTIPPVITQGMSSTNNERIKDHEGESSTRIPTLDDFDLA